MGVTGPAEMETTATAELCDLVTGAGRLEDEGEGVQKVGESGRWEGEEGDSGKEGEMFRAAVQGTEDIDEWPEMQ